MRDASSGVESGASRAWMSVGAPILGLVLVIIMLAVATFAGFAREQNEAFQETSARLVAGAIDGRVQSLAGTTVDYTNWQDAYDAVGGQVDMGWAEGNLYSSVVDGMIIVRANGATPYVWFSEVFQPQSEALGAAAVAAARAAPGLQRLVSAPSPAGTVATTYTVVDGQLLIVAVAPFTPEDDAERLALMRPPNTYLVSIDVLGADELASIGAALELGPLTLADPSSNNANVVGRMLVAASGAEVAQLQWRDARPGNAAFQSLVWPVVFAFVVTGLLAAMIARMLVTRQVAVLSRARSAIESSRAKSEFLTRVSHELRTPLNAVIGYAELIEEENEDTATREDARRIVSAARHLGALINDILDQSRIDAGRIKFNCEVLPVAGMVAEVQGLMGSAARANKVAFTTSTEAGAGFVFADHIRLRQCLINMVGNAIKFSPGGEVALVARREVRGEHVLIVFDVRDTGLGIARSEIDNVFRPFGQANKDISKQFGGTGLGLSISRDLARAMGGDIEVQSELGRGSIFSLAIPAANATALRVA